MHSIARIISYLFHPLWVPLIALFFLFQLPIFINYRLNQEYLNFTYLVFILNLVLAPLLLSLYLKKQKIIQSLEMETAKERSIPYLITSLFYIFTYFLLKKIDFPYFYLSLIQGAIFSIFILLLGSTRSYKFSAHMAAFGGFLGMLILANMYFKVNTTFAIALVILTSGVVASSRLLLKAHGGKEILIGYLIGLFSQLFQLFI